MRGACIAMLVLGLSACVSNRITSHTGRTATEQLLVSESIERAVASAELPELDGRTVAVAVQSLSAGDSNYLKAALEARVVGMGARIVNAGEAERLLLVRAGSIGTVARDALVGLPSIPLPSVGVTPDIPIFKFELQRAYTKMRIQTRDASGRQVADSAPVMEGATFKVYSILFFEIRRNDVYSDSGLAFGSD